MRYYELTYLISMELSEEEAKNFSQKIVSLIQSEGGVLVEENTPLRKRLAYPIKKPAVHTPQTQAYLTVFNFQLNPESLAILEKKLKSENQILRYLILTKKPPEVFQKPTIAKKPEEVIPAKLITHRREKKVELKDIEKKLEEILNEPQ